MDNYKTNNIYDLAGNYNEWTQEVGTYGRAFRGGSCYDGLGNNNPVIYRSYSGPDNNYGAVSSRPVLYMK